MDRGPKTLKALIEKVCKMLAFNRVPIMREEEEEDKRDIVLENVLLFIWLRIQFMRMYDRIRRGDVQQILDAGRRLVAWLANGGNMISMQQN